MAIPTGDRNAPDAPPPSKVTPDPSPDPERGDDQLAKRTATAAADTPPTSIPAAARPEVARRVPSTRVGAMWVALCASAVAFVALIVFLLQNTRSTQVSFLWMKGSAPLAVTLLIAAVGAALITALLGTIRIAQLRRLSRRRATPRRKPTHPGAA